MQNSPADRPIIPPKTLKSAKTSLHLLAIGALALFALIPLLIVDGVASERRAYYDEAQRDVAASWGLPQQLTGPVLIVPVTASSIVPPDGWQRPLERPTSERKHLVILPDELRITARVDHEMRKRAIYDIALFSADLVLSGRFGRIREQIEDLTSTLPGVTTDIDWTGVRLVLGVSDPRAIRLPTAGDGSDRAVPVRWNEALQELLPGEFDSITGSAVQAEVTVPEGDEGVDFEVRFGLGTTQSLSVSALGGETHYALESSWPHPSFKGQHLPIKRTISDRGFSAEWNVHGLARGLPDAWVHTDHSPLLQGQQMQVGFHNPVTVYTSVDRGIKYGLLFVALTFLTYLCIELITGVVFHAVQYAVVSLGLVMFYMTLLAASEHVAFGLSYAGATLLIAGLLAGYTWAMTRSKSITGLLFAVLLGLYGTMYVLLKLEDFALVMGTCLLLVGLCALMFATRDLHKSARSNPLPREEGAL